MGFNLLIILIITWLACAASCQQRRLCYVPLIGSLKCHSFSVTHCRWSSSFWAGKFVFTYLFNYYLLSVLGNMVGSQEPCSLEDIENSLCSLVLVLRGQAGTAPTCQHSSLEDIENSLACPGPEGPGRDCSNLSTQLLK